MTWIVSYRALSGVEMCTRHDTREDAFTALADQLLTAALKLWSLEDPKLRESGDRLVRHAIRLQAESEEPTDSQEGYLLNLSQGRRWLVAAT